MEFRFPVLAALLLALFAPCAFPAFLVGWGEEGGNISILCEGQQAVFVSSPGGGAERLALDGNFEAVFVPRESGPHTVQCGKETRAVNAAVRQEETVYADEEGSGLVFQLAFLALVFLFSAGFTYFLSKKLVLSQPVFTKSVRGNCARIFLQAGGRMDRIEIDDPVSMGFAGGSARHEIPVLAEGARFEYEYEIEKPERALPASLEAICNGKRIRLLSDIRIDGKTDAVALGKRAGPGRKLPKA